MDAGEAFEQMQIGRVMATNPESAAFMAARRKLGVRPGASPGKFGGVKGAADATRRIEYEQAIAAGTAR